MKQAQKSQEKPTTCYANILSSWGCFVTSSITVLVRALFVNNLRNKKNTEDRISKLPNVILMFIVSLLTTREGATTSILSRRWRNLWSTSVSCLDLDDTNVVGYQYPSHFFQDHIMKECRTPEKGLIKRERPEFINRVNRIWRSILQHRGDSPLHALRVSFPMGNDSASDLNRWMKLAAAQSVTQLELDFNFLDLGCVRDLHNNYVFPVQQFGSSLRYLRLRCCVFDFPPDFQSFDSLKSLSLYDSLLPINSVQNILSNCHSLEWLSLRDCEFSSLAILKFIGPSIPLKHLDISRCSYIKEIEMHNINLLSFELHCPPSRLYGLVGRKLKLSIRDVPRLARLVLHTNGPVEILNNVPRLDTLFLKHEKSKLPELSVFNNLSRLVFSATNHESNLFEVVWFLEACPLLQQLQIDMGIYRHHYRLYTGLKEEIARIAERHGCPHDNLKKVVIYGFDRHPDLIKLAEYLLENAIALEKMEIYRTSKSYYGNGIWDLSRTPEIELEGMSLKKLRKVLQKKANSSAKNIID